MPVAVEHLAPTEASVHPETKLDAQPAPLRAAWSGFVSALLIAIFAILAGHVHPAFLFLSLGAIVYEQIERPLARPSSPRNTLIGNAVALLVGYAMLAIFGLTHAPSTLVAGVTVARAFAVILAVGITAGLLILLQSVHPPAGSTLLLVVLGIVHQPAELGVVFLGVSLVTACTMALNRAAGIRVPLWAAS